MLGKRSAQQGMFEADTLYGEFVGQRTFYGYLANQRYELFRDADFAELYCQDNGRPSVPPSCWRRRWCCKPMTTSLTTKLPVEPRLISSGKLHWVSKSTCDRLPRAPFKARWES